MKFDGVSNSGINPAEKKITYNPTNQNQVENNVDTQIQTILAPERPNENETINITSKNDNKQNLIMLPALLKQKDRIENEIKRLDEQIKYANSNGEDEQVTRLETQKEMYKQQLNETIDKIEQEKAKISEKTTFGLAPDTKTEEEKEQDREIEKQSKETIDEVKKMYEEEDKEKKTSFKPEDGLA